MREAVCVPVFSWSYCISVCPNVLGDGGRVDLGMVICFVQTEMIQKLLDVSLWDSPRTFQLGKVWILISWRSSDFSPTGTSGSDLWRCHVSAAHEDSLFNIFLMKRTITWLSVQRALDVKLALFLNPVILWSQWHSCSESGSSQRIHDNVPIN